MDMDKKICQDYCYRKNYKSNSQKKEMDMLKLVVFDMDGVLTDILSSWKYLHDYFKTSNEKSVREYITGNIDDAEFIKRDVLLWKENGKAIKKEKLNYLLSKISIMNGAEKCISILSDNNIKTVIVSAGINILADRLVNELGIDYALSNGIKTDQNGYLVEEGVVRVKLMHKEEAVLNIAKKLKIPLKRIATVGNSCFDIPMFEITGLSIAFNPEDDCVKKAANFIVEDKDLTKILPFLVRFFV
jgi:phosphoserine phosphatase